MRATKSKTTIAPPKQVEDYRLPHKTVYLLGAGFSASMGMPTLQNFVQTALYLLKDELGHGSPEEKIYLTRLLEQINGYLTAVGTLPTSQTNLEDLWSYADLQLSVTKPAAERMANPLKDLMVQTIRESYLRHHRALEKLRSEGQPSIYVPTVPRSYLHTCPATQKVANADPHFNVCLYDAFLSRVLSKLESQKDYADEFDRDVIITLNQDLLIEYKLSKLYGGRPAAGIHYGVRDSGDASQVAPPGNIKINTTPLESASIPPDSSKRAEFIESNRDELNVCYGDEALGSYAECQFESSRFCYHAEGLKVPLVIPYLKLHGSANWKETGKISQTRKKTSNDSFLIHSDVLMTAPTWNKNPFGKEPLDCVLRNAAKHLRRASRVEVIGYSMPVTDSYLRHLFAYAFSTLDLPEITVWDVKKQADIDFNLNQMFSGNLRSRVTYKDTGLKGFVVSQPGQEGLLHE